ncbi:MAG: fumarylacetoacetate hydrolase [Comamonas sp.]|nr:fumarylacetoacetate hydrolase [Comamonas sp.]
MSHALRLVSLATATLLAACATDQPKPLLIAEPPGCLSAQQITAWADSYQSRQPASNPPADFTAADAACTRAKLQRSVTQQAGALIGYKAGLTNPAVQKRFNTDQPVWGALYENMLLSDGAHVPAQFGARPLYEADLLVRVKSSAIHQARTPAEVLEHIDQVLPFIELPDLMVQAPPKLNGNGVSAINVGARLGVKGKPLPIPTDAAARTQLLGQLQDMQVRLVDGNGQALGGGKGSDVLEHPLNAVIWLAQAVQEQGLSLQAGQVLSLGSFSALLPPKPGQSVSIHYDGVPGLESVTVHFD